MESLKLYVIVPAVENLLNFEGKKVKLPFKIGISKDPEKRLTQLQTGSFLPLKVLGCVGPFKKQTAFSLESEVHNLLAEYKTSGEWFMLNKTDLTKKASQLSLILGNKIVKELDDLIPFYKYHSKDAREYWEVLRFKDACNQVKPYLTKEAFWELVENDKTTINGKTFGVRCKSIKPKDKLEIAISVLGSYQNFL